MKKIYRALLNGGDVPADIWEQLYALTDDDVATFRACEEDVHIGTLLMRQSEEADLYVDLLRHHKQCGNHKLAQYLSGLYFFRGSEIDHPVCELQLHVPDIERYCRLIASPFERQFMTAFFAMQYTHPSCLAEAIASDETRAQQLLAVLQKLDVSADEFYFDVFQDWVDEARMDSERPGYGTPRAPR
jgi:hypothetical protein